MDDHLQPFTHHPICDKCRDAGQVDLKYSEIAKIAGLGEFLSTHMQDQEPAPHLVVTCRRCGYQWLMQTADAPDASEPLCACGHRKDVHIAWDPSTKRYVCQKCSCMGFHL